MPIVPRDRQQGDGVGGHAEPDRSAVRPLHDELLRRQAAGRRSPPAAAVTVPIRFADSGVAPHEIVHFKTELVIPDATPIDWATRKAGMRPSGISTASWEKIWPTFLALVGHDEQDLPRRAARRRRAARPRPAVAAPGSPTCCSPCASGPSPRAPGAPVHGMLTIAGKPARGEVRERLRRRRATAASPAPTTRARSRSGTSPPGPTRSRSTGASLTLGHGHRAERRCAQRRGRRARRSIAGVGA